MMRDARHLTELNNAHQGKALERCTQSSTMKIILKNHKLDKKMEGVRKEINVLEKTSKIRKIKKICTKFECDTSKLV